MTEFDREEAAFRAALSKHSANAPTALPDIQAKQRRPWWLVSVGAAAAIVVAATVGPLAARGPADNHGSPATAPSTSQPAPKGVDAQSTFAVIPSGPAPAEFIERAEQVATAVRASGGLTDYRSGVHLLSRVVTVPEDLPSDELETAFQLGLLTPGPAVTDEQTTTNVAFADDTTRQFEVLGARSALKLGRRGPSCAEENAAHPARPIDPCPVLINRARLTTQLVMTNHGAARFPAWEFWADGLTHPYVILAIEARDLQAPPTAEAVSAGTTPDNMLDGRGLITTTENSVTALLAHGQCDRGMLGHVWEAHDLIVVGGTQQGSRSAPCTAALVMRPSVLNLKKPLGTRPIVDISSGRILVAQR